MFLTFPDSGEFLARIAAQAARIEAASTVAAAVALEHVLAEANATAPIEEGTLIGSGRVTIRPGTRAVKGAVSYNTPYACRQHEEMTWRHDVGRRAKWLEKTLHEQAQTVGPVLAASIREAIG